MVVCDLEKIGSQAARAAYILGQLTTVQKNQALLVLAQELRAQVASIITANETDLQSVQKLPAKFLDRLRLTPERIEQMAVGIEQVTQLPDPIGEVTRGWVNHAGLQIVQKRVPLGVVGIIYEARPNVTADAAALCFKSGNAVILRGGKEAIRTNLQIGKILRAALQKLALPVAAIQVIEDTSHETANQLMQLTKYIDVLIPRGSSRLIQAVVQQAKVPVIETGAGNCHVFVDQTADFTMAEKIILNAKCQRPSVCNAMEKLLVHEKVAAEFLPQIAAKLTAAGVELRGDDQVQQLLGQQVIPATASDWDTEYNDLILAIKIVPSLTAAIDHINQHGTKHSETIITNDYQRSQEFLAKVDAAVVYVNASTRFTDGFEFGFGAEIGISTQKLHARGPMGLVELTTTKYQVRGAGQIRQ
ncbi:glutamate-5-semialdehyde dehydrogenase [Liquorilactobacillus sicerae]|uniref:glutamate-5-semialdehyde dehydrogenase n=1 Tax=Liquorilactobacillus sicerae TaxID=1416943 RepID=UPI0024819736|nr:glutamate-5-semialdehyde dehydrogenase [Liquorilactobacillus sicerae]